MLNRVFNLARRQKPQAFPPRKHALATACYGQEHELPELDTLARAGDDDAGHPETTLTDRATQHAPAPSGAKAPTGEPRLAIDQMRASIEDGLVMVFGPDGDPVPPQAVVRAAVERPEAVVALPDGTTVVARRLAMVLQAQTLGRLGAAEDGDGWIMTMLLGRDWPEMASEKALQTEQEPGVPEGRVDRLKFATASGSFLIADAGPEPTPDRESGEVMGLFLQDGAPISVVGLVGLLRERRGEPGRAIDALDRAVTAGDAGACGDPAAFDLSDCSVEIDADGVWLASPALAAVGGRLHLARWAARAPNGPVVSVSSPGGGAVSLQELRAALGMARDVAVDHDAPSEIDDANTRNGESDGRSRLDLAGDAARIDAIAERKPDHAPGWTVPDIALTVPALPRLELDSASVTVTDEGVLDPGFLDAFLPTGVDPSDGSEGLAAHDPPDRSPLDPLDHAPDCADVALPPTEGSSQAAILGHATDEAPSAAPDLPPFVASGRAEEIDPDTIVLVMVRGVPDGARLSAGFRDDDGSWSLSPLDLSSVTIMPAEASTDDAAGALDGDLIITGIALTEDGALAALSETVPMADYLSDPVPCEAVVEPAPGAALARPGDGSADPRPGAIALEVDPRTWDGHEFDALVIRDLPAGAGLSAGAYDPTIDGWVLMMPQDLSGLKIHPPAGQAADFTLTLMGVALRPGATSAVRVLTRLPVRLVENPGSPTAPHGDRLR